MYKEKSIVCRTIIISLLTPLSPPSNGSVTAIIYTGAFTHRVAVNWRRLFLGYTLRFTILHVTFGYPRWETRVL